MRRKKQSKMTLAAPQESDATGAKKDEQETNQINSDNQGIKEINQQQQQQQVDASEHVIAGNLIVMKTLHQRGRAGGKRSQVIRIKPSGSGRTPVMQLFVIAISLVAALAGRHLVAAQLLRIADSSSTIVNATQAADSSSTSTPESETTLSSTLTPVVQSLLSSTSTEKSLELEAESMNLINDLDEKRHESLDEPDATTTVATVAQTTTAAPTPPSDNQEATTISELPVTTQSSFGLSSDIDDADGELAVTSEYQENSGSVGKHQQQPTTSLPLAAHDDADALVSLDEVPSERRSTTSTTTTTQMVPVDIVTSTSTPASSQLIIRNRKSSPDLNNNNHNSSTASSKNGDAKTGAKWPETATNFSQQQQQQVSSAPPLDYDDFDLDYQLKLGDSSSSLGLNNEQHYAASVSQVNKRDYDNARNGPTPPPWSALVQGQHLFNSSMSPALLNETQMQPPTGSGGGGYNQHYEHAPPIMPALLTIKSAPLTSQELNRVRPQFLFYPDQYGGNPASAGELAPANGDLLATATNLNEQRQRLFEHLDSLKAAQARPQAPAANTTAAQASSLPSIDSSLQSIISSATAAALAANGKSAQTSETSNGSRASQMISLLNGSPLQSKQASLLDNLANATSGRQTPSINLAHLNNNKLNQKLTQATGSSSTEEPTQVTTIVVDSSTSPTEMPPPPRVYSQRTTTFAPSPSIGSTSTTTTAAPTTQALKEMSQATTSATMAASAGNSSQSHQWFNYPHPNLHHNPLLLHHILNKPPSFYAQNSADQTSQQLKSGATVGLEQQQASSATKVTTISSFLPQMQTTSTQAPQLPAASQSPAAVAPPAPHNGNTIIERPTYNAAGGSRQQPVNMTLLQMQLNEMRTIAAKSNQAAAGQSGGQSHWQQAATSELPGRDDLLNSMVQSALVKQQAQSNFRFVGPPRAPQMPQVPQMSHTQQTPWLQSQHQPMSSNMLHHLIGGNFSPLDGQNFVQQQQQQQRAPPLRPPSSPLASQVIAAPSLLQEVYTPRPTLPASEPSRPQQQQQQAESLSVSASNLEGNSTMTLSDEDMSTYVALLASLNTPASNGNGQKQPAPSESNAAGSSDEQQQQQLPHVVDQQSNRPVASVGRELEMLASLVTANQQQQAGQSYSSNNNGPNQQNWKSELMRGARLIGLSDEVQAQIYRDYLAPMNQGRRQPVRAPASAWPPPFIPPTTKLHPPMESSNALRSFAPMPTMAPHHLNGMMSTAPFNQHHHHQRPLSVAESGGSGHTFAPSPSSIVQERLRVELQQQHQRQLAFIEALKSSLAQLHEATRDQMNSNGTQANTNQTSASQASSVHSELDVFDESLSNSSSRPAPEWLEKQVGQDSLQVHELAHQQHQVYPHYSTGSSYHPTHMHLLHRPGGVSQYAPAWAQHSSHPYMTSAASAPRPTRFPIPIYPLRALFPSHRPALVQAGPQPRLLWPAPVTHTHGQLMSEGSTRVALTASPTPLVRLNGGGGAPAQQVGQVTSTALPLLLQPTPPQASLYPMQPPLTMPTKIMLDRFPITAAPAYLVKLPTLTGGTITASGSLVAPQPKFWRRPQAPAAFISASPIGALRFLSALTPPRMRLIQPTQQHQMLPPMLGPLSQHPGAPYGLQPASSMVHVHHSPIMEASAPPASGPSYTTAHLHPVPHLHHHHGSPGPELVSSSTSSAPPRLQIYVNSSPPPATISASASTPASQSSGAPPTSSPGNSDNSNSDTSSNSAEQTTTSSNSNNVQSGQTTPALTRLQQATASLVELTSLASLLDEMVGGSDFESSPAAALANAINSLSAAQNAAALSAQASANGESARLVVPNGNGQQQLGNAQQQQMMQLSNHNGGPSLWRNLFAPNLWRQQSQLANGGQMRGLAKQRDFSALERLLAHAATAATGGVAPNSARLKVKYIRVPVAVYETGAPQLGDTSLQLATLNNQGGGGGGSSQARLPGELAGISNSPLSHELTSTSATGGDPGSALGTSSGHSSSTSSSSASSTATSGVPHAAQGASGLIAPSASSSSNEFLFDEMSAESGLNYMLNAHGQHQHHAVEGAPNSLGYLPIVRALPKGTSTGEPNAFYPLTAASSQQMALINSLAAATAQHQQLLSDEDSESGRSKGKKRKNKKKGKRKGKKSFLLGSDDDDDDDDEEAQASGESGSSDDDDALSPSDLPIIESLISTIIHGAPPSLVQQHQLADHMAAAHSSPSGWRSARAYLRPFSTGGSSSGPGFTRHNRHNQLLLAPEASSQVLSYAHPATGLPVSAANAALAASSSQGHRSIWRPFQRDRGFSLSEVVGALGAKKLIASLLGRRKSPARTSKRAAAAAAGTATATAAATAAAIAVTPATSFMSAAFGGGSRRASGTTSTTTTTTSTTQRPASAFSYESHAINHTVALLTPWRRHSIKVSWPKRTGVGAFGTTRKPSTSSKFGITKHKKQQADSEEASTTSLDDGEQERIKRDRKRFVLGDNYQPLVYPAIAAYESDSFARPTQRPRSQLPTTSGPTTTTAPFVLKTSHTSSSKRPQRREAPKRPEVVELSPLESGNNNKLINSTTAIRNNNNNNSNSDSPAVLDFEFVLKAGNHSTGSGGQSTQSSKRHSSRHKTNSRGPDDLDEVVRERPKAQRGGAQLAEGEETKQQRKRPAMPLYHVVADHYNKQNAGHTPSGGGGGRQQQQEEQASASVNSTPPPPRRRSSRLGDEFSAELARDQR